MKWFYDKEIQIGTRNGGLDEDTGLYSKGELESFTINCDVQPLDTTKDVDESGKLIDAQYKVFCDVDSDINIHSEITYKDDLYSIVKITDWDDYLILYIKAVH